MWGPRVFQSKQNHAPRRLTSQRGQVAEVQVEREDNAVLVKGFCKDLIVRSPVEALLAEMYGVMSITAEPFYDPYVHAHVGEESHQ